MTTNTTNNDWHTPTELPDLRRAGIVALDTETKDEGLAADRGSAWPWRDGYVCGASVAYREGENIRTMYFPLRHPDTKNVDREQFFGWLTDLLASDVRIVTQNGLYDWGWLHAEAGIRMPPAERLEDNDETGRAHVIEVAEALRRIVPDIRIVAFRDLPEHGDLTDWKEGGHRRDELLAKIEATKPYRPQPQPSPIRQWDGEPVPELEYSVPDRYPLDNVGLFSGEGGQGKSSLVQQLCCAHVLGREWLGCTPRQGPAVYIECEDAERVLHWRLKAVVQHYGTTLAAIADAGFQMYPLADEENAVLATAPDKSGIVRPTPLYDWLFELAGDVKPVMIGIASSANVFAGNENVRTEVQQCIRLLRRIAAVAHGTVLLMTQPSLTGIGDKSASHEGLAGTTQWHNGVRARAVMKTVKPEDGVDTGLRAITFHKNQYGPAVATCFVHYENGLFLPVEGAAINVAERAARAEELFVALLKQFTEQHQMVSHASGRAYAPARFAEHPNAKGFTRTEFKRAMQRLLDAKIIEIRTWGPPSRLRQYLALVVED